MIMNLSLLRLLRLLLLRHLFVEPTFFVLYRLGRWANWTRCFSVEAY